MNKTKFSAYLSTALVCFLFWLVITGQAIAIFRGGMSATVLIAGAVVSILTALFSANYFIHTNSFRLWNPIRIVYILFYTIIVFGWELIKSNIDVAKRALSPKMPINPGIVRVPVNISSEYGQAMVANSITLTPGTITLASSEDEEGNTCFYIHWLDVKTEDGQEAGEMIKGKFEKWCRRIWE